MATATKTADPKAASTDPAEGEKKKGGKKKKIIIAVLVLLVAGAAWFMFLKPKGPPPPPQEGAVITLEPITLNLAKGHFLKLGLALQATKDAHEPPDGAKALDIAIAQLSGREIEELSSVKGRDKVKEELTEAVVEGYHEHVMEVYFTAFTVQ